VPAGIEDGGRVRLAGKGDEGVAGGGAGDAFLRIRVEPDAVFRREGSDLLCDVQVGLSRAALGGTVSIPTLDGPAAITLPPGTRSGQKLRLKGKGVPASGSHPSGDLYAVVQIVPPRKLDARSRELLEEFARLNPEPV
jgi:DnaJ-class molecular chaperone